MFPEKSRREENAEENRLSSFRKTRTPGKASDGRKRLGRKRRCRSVALQRFCCKGGAVRGGTKRLSDRGFQAAVFVFSRTSTSSFHPSHYGKEVSPLFPCFPCGKGVLFLPVFPCGKEVLHPPMPPLIVGEGVAPINSGKVSHLSTMSPFWKGSGAKLSLHASPFGKGRCHEVTEGIRKSVFDEEK